MTATDDGNEPRISEFPGPYTLRSSRRKLALLLIAAALFCFGSLWMIFDLARSEPLLPSVLATVLRQLGVAQLAQAVLRSYILVIGWASLGFFGLGGMIVLINMLPGASTLTLDKEGFTTRNMFRRCRYTWRDASDFAAVKVGDNKMVIFNLLSAAQSKLAKLSFAIAARNGALADTYGLPAEDLAALMSLWRERAIMR
jgi:hypothetical protein